MKLESWWTCSCGAPIYRVGKGRGQAWEQHLKVCAAAKKGMRIVRRLQGKP